MHDISREDPMSENAPASTTAVNEPKADHKKDDTAANDPKADRQKDGTAADGQTAAQGRLNIRVPLTESFGTFEEQWERWNALPKEKRNPLGSSRPPDHPLEYWWEKLGGRKFGKQPKPGEEMSRTLHPLCS